jgi:hypothetical protein
MWGFQDEAGKYIFDPQFYHTTSLPDGGAVVARTEETCGIIDDSGQYTLPLQSHMCILTDPEPNQRYSISEGCICFCDKDDGLYGFLDLKGRIMIPSRFLTVHAFSEGLACVSERADPEKSLSDPTLGMLGYIDRSGRFIVPPQFSDGSSFSEGLAAVEVVESKWGFTDNTGHFVISPQFDSQPSDFKSGLARVKRNGLFGFISKTCHFIIMPVYADAGSFSDGLARVRCR